MTTKDLGQCPRCDDGKHPLVAVLASDLAAWDAEGCPACHATWCFQWPRSLGEIPEGAKRLTWGGVKGT